MRVYKILPEGWPCTLLECRPGPFITMENPELLCFKSEYRESDGRVTAYNSAGEFFCGNGNAEMVQPVTMVVEDTEE